MQIQKIIPVIIIAFLFVGCASQRTNIDQGFEDNFLKSFKTSCISGCEGSCNEATDNKQPAICQKQCETNCQCASDAYHEEFKGQSFLKMTEISHDPVKANDIIRDCLGKNK